MGTTIIEVNTMETIVRYLPQIAKQLEKQNEQLSLIAGRGLAAEDANRISGEDLLGFILDHDQLKEDFILKFNLAESSRDGNIHICLSGCEDYQIDRAE